jgi:hypothetical protein
MTNLYDGKGYIPPDEPDTGGEYYHICVAIPRAMEYLVAFFGSLDGLATWKCWARDPERKGKVAATVWKAANEITHANFALGECEATPMSFDLRVKPGTPWIMQASTDGGVTWHDALIQPNWGGSSTGSPPASDIDQQRNIAAGLIWFLQWLAGQINDGLDAAEGRTATIDRVMGQLAPYGAGAEVRTAVGQAYDKLAAVVPDTDRPDYETDCPYSEEWVAMTGNAAENPDNWIDQLAGWLADAAFEAADEVIGALNDVGALMSGQSLWNFVQNNGGGGGGAGFGADCDYMLVPMARNGYTLVADGTSHQQCTKYVVTVPTGYQFVAVWTEYEVDALDAPYTSLAPHTGVDCGGVGAEVEAWGATSEWLIPANTGHRWLSLDASETSALFDLLGFDTASAMSHVLQTNPTGNGHGPIDVVVSYRWYNQSDALNLSGSVRPIAILKKL